MAHRAYYQERHGPIPDGYQLDHLCRVRACVNPDHLEVVTARENIRRGNGTKLTEDDVRAIRASSEKQRVLAATYGVSQSQISRIRNWLTWRE
jgi:HNH endonuclease